MQQLKDDCQEINNFFIKNTFQYDIPYCLTAPYKNDVAYLSILSIQVGIVSPRPLLDNYKIIKLYYYDNQEVNQKQITLISSNKQINFDYPLLNKVFNYNVKLQMSWYMLPYKNLKAHTFSIHNFVQGGNRNYMFVPLSGEQIDYEFIDSFLMDGDSRRDKCLRSMDLDDPKTFDKIYYIPKTLTLNCVYSILLLPWTQTVQEYFNIIIEHSQFTIEGLKEYYSIDDSILEKTIGYFFYEHQFKAKTENINNILQLRSLQNQMNQKQSPLAIYRQVTSLQRIQYYTEDQIQNKEMKTKQPRFYSCKPKLEITNLQIQMSPISNLYEYLFSIEQYDNFMMLPVFMLQFEQQMIVSEFANSIGLRPSETVQKVITRPSYNRDENYELFETLGDSILKFLGTLAVMLGPQNMNENKLSDLRSQIVNNLFLANHLYKYQYYSLFHYIRSLSHQTKWYGPVLQNIHSNHIQPESLKSCEAKMQIGCIADLFESLIAAVFLDNYSLKEVYQYLLYLRHPVSMLPANPIYFPHQSIVLQFEPPIMDNCMSFKDLVNAVDPIPEYVKQYILQGDVRCYDYIQDVILQYKFKNVYILYEAFNINGKFMDTDLPLELYYKFLLAMKMPSTRGQQMLELMGDAVLECFIMCNCFVNILFKFTPTNLYKIKMVLLSNSFLSKVAIGYNINWFLPDKDHIIEQFIINVNWNEKFTQYNGNFVRVPKILSDTFEAIVGAVFMDGGWEPVLKFLKRVYIKFIPFVCTYLNEMDNHVIDRVHQFSATKQAHTDIKSFRVENGLYCCEVRIEGTIVGRYCHEHERVAKEKACESACKRLKI